MKSKKNIPAFNNELPPMAVEYLTSIHEHLAHGTCLGNRTTILRFHRWMKACKISIKDITPEQLIEHKHWCATQGIQLSTSAIAYYNARAYMIWLIRSGHLDRRATDFFQFSLIPVELPDFTHLFLKQRAATTKYAHVRYRQLLHLFHNWLLDQKLDVVTLDRDKMLSFLSFLNSRGYTARQLHIRHLYMRTYTDWLRDRDITKIDFFDIFQTTEQFRNYKLPDFTEEYLLEIQTTLREGTVKSYKTNFMGLHRFLHRRGIDIRNITRENCVDWARFMFEKKKYSQSTRLQRLVNTRGYLDWLAERGIIKENVDKLIKSSDFPKLDLFLPKPLPSDVDAEIQRRLWASDNIYHKGALLLRFTGMRLGELANLSFDPIWRDDANKTFIKVPIGKLHSERLVPIDDKTINLIKTIQQGSLPHLRIFSKEPEKGKLLLGPRGGSALHNVYRFFKIISKDIKGCGSIHPHRLRHTFATVLMNADLDPHIVMTLLGHKDMRMTDRYALILKDTVYRSFFKATEQSTFKVDFKFPKIGSQEFDPATALENVTQWIQREQHSEKRKTTLIIKRLNRLRIEIKDLIQ